MHILFLTDNFPPEVNAPASRTFEHCREWVRAGCRVTVITGVPNFPNGEVLAGYRNWPWQREEYDGINVIRVMTYITANEGFLRRTLDYLSFMVTSFLAGLFVRRPDIIVGTSPQFFTVCSAWMLSVFRRRPFVFELRDLWPESIKVVGAMKHPFWLERLERLEQFLYRKASLIITVTHSFRDTLMGRGIDGDKIKVVTNGVDLDRYRPGTRNPELLERHGLRGQFVLGYIGTHGLAHSLETIIDAATLLRDSGEGKSCAFLFLGDGARKQALKAYCRERDLDNVLFVDSVPKDEVVMYWSLLDAAIIHLKKTALFETVIPSKLFESMAMGVPVLHGVAGESARIVERENVGILFEPESAAGLCNSIKSLLVDRERYEVLKKNCLAAARKYDRKQQAGAMLEYLKTVGVK